LLKREVVLLVILVAFITVYANLEVHREIVDLTVDRYQNIYLKGTAKWGLGAYQFVTMLKPDAKLSWTRRSSDIYLGKDEHGIVTMVQRQENGLLLQQYNREGKPSVSQALSLPKAWTVAGVRGTPQQGFTILSKQSDPAVPVGDTGRQRSRKLVRHLWYSLSEHDRAGTLQRRRAVGVIRLDTPAGKVSLSGQALDEAGHLYVLGHRVQRERFELQFYPSNARDGFKRPLTIGSAAENWVAGNLALDSRGRIYLLGSSANASGNGAAVPAVLGIYQPADERLEVRRFQIPGAQRIGRVALSPADRLYISGVVPSPAPGTKRGVTGLILQSTPDGADRIQKLAIASSSWQGLFTVDGQECVYLAGGEGRGFFLAKYDPAQRRIWHKQYLNSSWLPNVPIALLVLAIVFGPLLQGRERKTRALGA
jgi:hypothetical protein